MKSSLYIHLVHLIDQLLEEQDKPEIEGISEEFLTSHPTIQYLSLVLNSTPSNFVRESGNGYHLYHEDELNKAKQKLLHRQREQEAVKSLQYYSV